MTRISLNGKTDLLSRNRDELKSFMVELGEPAYRAEQIFTQLHRGISPDEMTNIPKKLKETLLQCACYPLPTVEKKLFFFLLLLPVLFSVALSELFLFSRRGFSDFLRCLSSGSGISIYALT